ncbi:hypothetical protein B0H66DRAFT_643143 [Apodospora peruviana]|uniref:DUF7689 domain-containing protein n=1 Tax=Apodospora peruviana TaxID=516989 RepID=A0AAE0LZG2_9PEZI|nr:hypothetical protein B0H66DRAFT_643143 [Apodospora peruviana]
MAANLSQQELADRQQFHNTMRAYFDSINQAPAPPYTIIGPYVYDNSYNCFGYAVYDPAWEDQNDPYTQRGRINAQSWDQLDDDFDRRKFYRIDFNTPRQANDVEVYQAPHNTGPSHAHKILDPVSGLCASKQEGQGLIQHDQYLLTSHMPNDPSSFKYGALVALYRRDEAEHNRRWVKTKSNRKVRAKDAEKTKSGRGYQLKKTVKGGGVGKSSRRGKATTKSGQKTRGLDAPGAVQQRGLFHDDDAPPVKKRGGLLRKIICFARRRARH